MKNNTLLIF